MAKSDETNALLTVRPLLLQRNGEVNKQPKNRSGIQLVGKAQCYTSF